MPLNQPLKMDLDLVRRLLGQDIEIVNKTGSSRIAVAEGVPIYLDKATQQVKLEYLSSLGGINFALGGIDAYQFLADTLNFANDAKFIQNPAGVKDASGTKRITIVQPGDDVKAKLEAAPNGCWVIILPGEYYTSSAIDLSAKCNFRVTGFGFATGTDYDPTIIYTDQNIKVFDFGSNGGWDNVVVENLRIEQRGGEQGYGIYCSQWNAGKQLFLDRVYVYDFTYGILYQGGSRIHISRCIADNCSTGIYARATEEWSYVERCFARNNYIGIYIAGSRGLQVLNCDSNGNSYNYLYANISGTTYPIFKHCHSRDAGSAHIRLETSYDPSSYPVFLTLDGFYVIGNGGEDVIRFTGSYSATPIIIRNFTIKGDFAYFMQNQATNKPAIISSFISNDARDATFSSGVFDDTSYYTFEEIGHNVGLL